MEVQWGSLTDALDSRMSPGLAHEVVHAECTDQLMIHVVLVLLH